MQGSSCRLNKLRRGDAGAAAGRSLPAAGMDARRPHKPAAQAGAAAAIVRRTRQKNQVEASCTESSHRGARPPTCSGSRAGHGWLARTCRQTSKLPRQCLPVPIRPLSYEKLPRTGRQPRLSDLSMLADRPARSRYAIGATALVVL
jgi:hypothetical protein